MSSRRRIKVSAATRRDAAATSPTKPPALLFPCAPHGCSRVQKTGLLMIGGVSKFSLAPTSCDGQRAQGQSDRILLRRLHESGCPPPRSLFITTSSQWGGGGDETGWRERAWRQVGGGGGVHTTPSRPPVICTRFSDPPSKEMPPSAAYAASSATS